MTDYRYQHLLRQDCPLPPGTHVVVYCRDSGGEEQDRSVTQQADAAREYCERWGLVIDHLYIDEATSATSDRRDAFADMLHDLRTKFALIYDPSRRARRSAESAYGVLCWKSNRLGRDLLHTRYVKSDLRLRGLTIVPLIATVETGNAALDTLIEGFIEYQDQQLLTEISQNVKRGLSQLVSMRDTDPDFLAHNPGWSSTGAYLGILPGVPPTGFKPERIVIGTHKRKGGNRADELREVQRIVPDPDTWDLARLAWKMRRDGASHKEIMAATHLFPKIASLATFFGNRIYTGTLVYGGQILGNFVPALIPQSWFDDEQARRAERAKKTQGQSVAPEYEPRRVHRQRLLSGLLYCGAVDGEEHLMHAEHSAKKTGADGKRQRGDYTFYGCSVRKVSRGSRCRAPRISAKIIEPLVIEALMRDVLTLDTLRPVAALISQQLDEQNNDAGTRLTALKVELVQVEQQIANLLDAIENMGLSVSLREKLTKREGERERLASDIASIERMLGATREMPAVSEDLLSAWLDGIRAALRHDDVFVARAALRQFVQKVVIRPGGGEIYYTFPVSGASLGERVARPEGRILSPRLRQPFTLPSAMVARRAGKLVSRDAEIVAMYARTQSPKQVAEAFGLTPQRIWEIIGREQRRT